MAKLHVTQIGGFLHKAFDGLVDMSDWKAHKEPAQVDSAFLSRALAAYGIAIAGGCDYEAAAKSITDGAHDNGIDAIYFDPVERTLYLAQSKWSADGTSTIDRGEVQKFIHGVRALLDADYGQFNAKVASRKTDIERALLDASARFCIVIAHTGQANLGAEPQKDLDDFVASQNDPSAIFKLRVLGQGDIHNTIATGTAGKPIDAEIQLYEWGQIKEPHYAVYGQVAASDIASLYEKFGNSFFSPNLRVFLGTTEANDDIVETASKNPSDFWYFNNGVTALCTGIAKKPIGGNSHESGVFECHGLTVVNGAQTVGSLATAMKLAPKEASQARVQIRMISLEKCPADFSANVTRSNNTQNAVQKRDFVALDADQERFRRELAIEGITYSYKSGEQAGDPNTYFDLTEATLAQVACQADLSLAVQAKREIGKLWDDVTKAPYKALFNAGINGPEIWSHVKLLRSIQQSYQKQTQSKSGRDSLICVHGNRLAEWSSAARIFASKDFSENGIESAVAAAVEATIASVKKLYPDAYPASLFKNATKCKALAQAMGH